MAERVHAVRSAVAQVGSTQRLAASTKWLVAPRDGVMAAFSCKQSHRLGDEPVQTSEVTCHLALEQSVEQISRDRVRVVEHLHTTQQVK